MVYEKRIAVERETFYDLPAPFASLGSCFASFVLLLYIYKSKRQPAIEKKTSFYSKTLLGLTKYFPFPKATILQLAFSMPPMPGLQGLERLSKVALSGHGKEKDVFLIVDETRSIEPERRSELSCRPPLLYSCL